MRTLLISVLLPIAMGANPKDDANALKLALADERLARATYEVVMEAFGEKPPFSNIIRAETQHAKAVELAMARHGIPVPADNTKKPAKPESWEAALKTAIEAEKENVALYDRIFKLDLSPDVRRVLENLRNASQERHLPAFERALAGDCTGNCGGMGAGKGQGQGNGWRGGRGGQGMGQGNGRRQGQGMGQGQGRGQGQGQGQGFRGGRN